MQNETLGHRGRKADPLYPGDRVRRHAVTICRADGDDDVVVIARDEQRCAVEGESGSNTARSRIGGEGPEDRAIGSRGRRRRSAMAVSSSPPSDTTWGIPESPGRGHAAGPAERPERPFVITAGLDTGNLKGTSRNTRSLHRVRQTAVSADWRTPRVARQP